jgi:hypothetical protein
VFNSTGIEFNSADGPLRLKTAEKILANKRLQLKMIQVPRGWY